METQQTGSLKDFDVLKKLGQGAFGQVFLVRRKADSLTYALKKVKLMGMKIKEKQNALNQIRILASLNDEYIVKFKQAFFDSQSNYLCIIMEYASGGDLLKFIQIKTRSRSRIDQDEIWKALIHIVKGLKSLHSKKILHRDLKCANIFIDGNGNYKLGDLNVSKVLKKGLAYTQTGTPYYASPEVWQDLPYDMKSDMWSLGCVIYEMAALQPPFKAQDLQGLYKKVKQGRYKPISTYYSSQLSQIISLLLKVRPKQRPDTEALLKNTIIKRKCGMKLNQQDYAYEEMSNQDLLKTIKFNAYNLHSLKLNLPKSSYGNQGEYPIKQRQRRDSLNNLQYPKRERILSAGGIRRDQIGQSPSYNRKEAPKIQNPPHQKQSMGLGLPPRPQKKPGQQVNREPSNRRLRRIGEDIVGSGRGRSSSVNR